MTKESKCKADITMKCVSSSADLTCRHYQESRHTPLKCAHRSGDECFHPDAFREAAKGMVATWTALLTTPAATLDKGDLK